MFRFRGPSAHVFTTLMHSKQEMKEKEKQFNIQIVSMYQLALNCNIPCEGIKEGLQLFDRLG